MERKSDKVGDVLCHSNWFTVLIEECSGRPRAGVLGWGNRTKNVCGDQKFVYETEEIARAPISEYTTIKD